MVTRAPKKFTDDTRSVISPEWSEWYAQAAEELREDAHDVLLTMGHRSENFFPEEDGKDIGDGAWIFVVEEPFTELKQRFTIPTPSLWWARPETARPHGIEVGSGGASIKIPGPYRVIIETPGGTLWLFPHEYVVCKDPIPLITDPECIIHPLGGEVTLNEEKQEQLFYLMSRGLTHGDALLLIMDGVDMSRWGWVEFPEYARAAFEGVGRRLIV